MVNQILMSAFGVNRLESAMCNGARERADRELELRRYHLLQHETTDPIRLLDEGQILRGHFRQTGWLSAQRFSSGAES